MKLQYCPCGKVPEKLTLTHSGDGVKWAWVSGHCCGEWNIEFKTRYSKLDSDKCMQFATVAWNNSTRGR